jgi:hypothetical protein
MAYAVPWLALVWTVAQAAELVLMALASVMTSMLA